MVFDVGNNLTSLGFAFLFLRYVLPVVVVLIIGGIALYLFSPLIKNVTQRLGGLSKKQMGLLVLLVLLLILAGFAA